MKYFLLGMILMAGCNSQPSQPGIRDSDIRQIISAEIASLNSNIEAQIAANLQNSTKEKPKLNLENMISKSDLDANSKEHWLYILGILGTGAMSYLTKEIISARANGIRDTRLDIFEKLILGDKVTKMPEEDAGSSNS